MKQRILPGLLAALGMGILILDSRTALEWGAEGIDLCFRTIIPSLFPFFLLSGILVSSFAGSSIQILRSLGRLLRMPDGTETLLISGFLGGYPIGAAAIREAWHQGSLQKEDAERLLSFCNNAGPAFLFGMAAQFFSERNAAWVLWGIHILSALTVGVLFRKEPQKSSIVPARERKTLPQALNSAILATAQVCGWVILFRVLCGFLTRWFLWLLPDWTQVLICGLLELANGILELDKLSSRELRFLLCSVVLSFGGLCVLLQTYSAARGLNIRYYVMGKLSQSIVSLLLSLLYLRILSRWWVLLMPAILFLRKKSGKRGSNPRLVRV